MRAFATFLGVLPVASRALVSGRRVHQGFWGLQDHHLLLHTAILTVSPPIPADLCSPCSSRFLLAKASSSSRLFFSSSSRAIADLDWSSFIFLCISAFFNAAAASPLAWACSTLDEIDVLEARDPEQADPNSCRRSIFVIYSFLYCCLNDLFLSPHDFLQRLSFLTFFGRAGVPVKSIKETQTSWYSLNTECKSPTALRRALTEFPGAEKSFRQLLAITFRASTYLSEVCWLSVWRWVTQLVSAAWNPPFARRHLGSRCFRMEACRFRLAE